MTESLCLAGINGVGFFFSAIACYGKGRNAQKSRGTADKDGQAESEDTDEEGEIKSSQVAATSSSVWIWEHRSVVDRKMCPAISYWIALTTPNGAPANPLIVHRALLECGMERVVAKQVIISKRTMGSYEYMLILILLS